jgi:hypothetical protein
VWSGAGRAGLDVWPAGATHVLINADTLLRRRDLAEAIGAALVA